MATSSASVSKHQPMLAGQPSRIIRSHSVKPPSPLISSPPGRRKRLTGKNQVIRKRCASKSRPKPVSLTPLFSRSSTSMASLETQTMLTCENPFEATTFPDTAGDEEQQLLDFQRGVLQSTQMGSDKPQDTELEREEVGKEIPDREPAFDASLIQLEIKQEEDKGKISSTLESNATTEVKTGPDSASSSSSLALLGSRVLKGILQNPHFLPLEKYSERARKNLVSGWDQTFEDTVDLIHNLRLENFRTDVEELWKTLEELESLGYNVRPLRKRLNELTDLIIKAEDHRKEKMRTESKITELKLVIDELMDLVAKMEKNLPEVDASFTSLAMPSFETFF